MKLLFPKLDIDFIFDKYDKEKILAELKKLKLFCFLRGRLNSYVTDGDILVAHFSFTGRQDLLEKLTSIGIEPKILKSQDERLDKPKPAELANSLPTPIKNIPDIAQPYSQKIFGIDTCIIVNNDYFSISVADKSKKNWYFVNDKELEFAKTLENYFLKIGLDKYLTYEGQKEYGRYLNRNNYPEIFDE